VDRLIDLSDSFAILPFPLRRRKSSEDVLRLKDHHCGLQTTALLRVDGHASGAG
jgi:hypothetical protein